ncbi:MAG: hypothetical protein E7057_03665 [Lentisphaerae bacterium]|nr:hypothetical protein [Lentisphaerota bacterium]
MMKAFLAIISLTFRNAMRSHVFQLLLVVLMLCVTLIPFSVSVGKAEDLIRVSLLYSLWSVSIILTLSSLYLGCYVMSHDIDSYQIHMVVSKPVSRITIWLGKWLGINLINVILLLIAGLVVYGMVMYRYQVVSEEGLTADRQSAREMAQAEKERIRTQVLVGRRSYMPELRDPEEIANAAVRNKVKEMAAKGESVTDEQLVSMRDEIKSQLDKLPVEVLYGSAHTWTYKNLPEDLNKSSLTLRFRPYLGKVSSEEQRQSQMSWAVLNPKTVKTAGEEGSFMYAPAESYFTGEFHEKNLPTDIIDENGTLKLRVVNADSQKGKLYFQTADGPKLLVPVCGFELNYLRAMLVMIVQLLLLSGIACAFGGFLTMPTAIFMVASYLLFGAISLVLTDSEFFVTNIWDQLGRALANVLLWVVIPLQNFDVTDMLSGGELIEFSFIGNLFVNYFLLRGVPLFLFGMLLYRRREMGSAVRK